MAQAGALFRLPRELRDEVYRHYFTTDDGLVFIHTTNKLHYRRKGLPMRLALVYTCKLIAMETHGLALQMNLITFTTTPLCDKSTAKRASRFEKVTNSLYLFMANVVHESRSIITGETVQEARVLYPQSGSLLHHLTTDLGWSIMYSITTPKLWGMAPSTHHRLITYLFQAVWAHPRFTSASFLPPLKYSCQRFSKNARRAPLGFPNIQPWDIPTDDEIEYLESLCLPQWGYARLEQQARCFSAVSLFIQFFNALPRTPQAHVRNVRLFEGHTSATLPEFHALGLLPIISTNRLLRIERCVNIRRAALANPHMWRNTSETFNGGISNPRDNNILRPLITQTILAWIEEALA